MYTNAFFSTLRYSRVNGAWLRRLPINNNLLLSVLQERLNPLVNITTETIFIILNRSFLWGTVSNALLKSIIKSVESAVE